MKKLILSALLSATLYADGITPFAGLAMNGTDNFKSESPIGVFGVKYLTKYTNTYFRHISSIPQMDETQGINEFGLNLKYRVKFFEPYVGIAYTNEELTSKYYTDQLANTSYVVGANIKYEDKDIFIEYKKNKKQDVFMYGFVFNFDTQDLMK